MLKQKIKVTSFRKIPNPYKLMDLGEKEAEMYIAICDVKDIPNNIPMKTNPREQKLTTNVAKKIKASLVEHNNYNFHLLNRGLLLSAKNVSYNNYANEMTLTYEDIDFHGDVDGGHTYKIILENREHIEYEKQFVKIEILTGVESIFQDLAAARNTSTQVQDKSIAELEKRFELIKNVIGSEPFSSNVYFKENDEGDIDVSEILAILNLFNIDRYPSMDNFPITSYSGKKKCIDYYIEAHKNHKENSLNPYVKMKPIMNDFFKLYDMLEVSAFDYYRAKNSNGKYGAIKGVSMKKNGLPYKTKFYANETFYLTPNGFLFPILGAFRALINEKNGVYSWKKDPFAVLNDIGKDLIEITVERSRSLGHNPNAVGKDQGNWKTLYMSVMLASMV